MEPEDLLCEEAWKPLHYEFVQLVDMHNHLGTKAMLLGTRIARLKSMRDPNPVTVRTSFPRLTEGGVDVCVSAVYIPERELLDDIAAFNLFGWKFLRLKYLGHLIALLPIIGAEWSRLMSRAYFTTALDWLQRTEDQIRRYNDDVPPTLLARLGRLITGRRPKRPPKQIRLAHSVTDMQNALDNKQIAVIHSVEGAHCLETEDFRRLDADAQRRIALDNLHHLFERGVAVLTLAHFYPNCVAYPCFPLPQYALNHVPDKRLPYVWRDLTCGLTDLGREIVREMLEIGMIIDVSHCTPTARSQIYRIVDSMPHRQGCVVATHVGAYGINPTPYNLKDWEIRWIAEHGGVVGVIFMNYFLTPHGQKFGLDYISQTIEHMVNVAGIDVVAIGTDFDGFTDTPDELVDASQMPRLTQRLVSESTAAGQRKYSDTDVNKILGDNALRVLETGWGKQV